MGKKKNRNGGENRNDNQENQNNNQQKEEENDNQQKEENNDQQKEETKKNDGGGKKNDGGGKKDDPPLLTIVLKMEVHCEGCATKIRKAVRRFKGVDSVRTDLGPDKVTVVGRLDPSKLREFLEQKMKRKVEQLSPAPKKEKENNNKDGNGGGEKKKEGEKPEKKTEEKKPKELPITTAVMKLNLHCQGCIQKIRKTIANTKGFLDLSFDEQKNQVTVKGAMDMKALAEALKEKMKKPVEIVPPKKDGGDKKDKDGGEGNNDKGGEGNGGEKKQKGGGQGGKGGGAVDESQVVFYANPSVNGYGSWFGYPVANYQDPAPQIFSDENPNACSVM